MVIQKTRLLAVNSLKIWQAPNQRQTKIPQKIHWSWHGSDWKCKHYDQKYLQRVNKKVGGLHFFNCVAKTFLFIKKSRYTSITFKFSFCSCTSTFSILVFYNLVYSNGNSLSVPHMLRNSAYLAVCKKLPRKSTYWKGFIKVVFSTVGRFCCTLVDCKEFLAMVSRNVYKK